MPNPIREALETRTALLMEEWFEIGEMGKIGYRGRSNPEVQSGAGDLMIVAREPRYGGASRKP